METAPRPNRLPIFALLTGNAISLVGSALSGIALPWFVLQTTGSAAKTGLTAFFELLPMILAGFLGGTLVDRLGFKFSSISADLLSGIAIGLIPVLHLTGHLEFWQLLVLVFLSSLFNGPGRTARQSMIPDLAKMAGMSLEWANASTESIRRLSQLLGPVLAGLLIALLGPSNVLWLDAASFGVSAIMVLMAVPALRSKRTGPTRYWADFREGLSFFGQDKLVLSVALVLCLTNLILNPLFIVILPFYANTDTGNPLTLGLMISVFGGGTLAGALFYGWYGSRLSRRWLFLSSLVVDGLVLWPISLLPDLPLLLGLLLIMGLAIGPIGPLVMTVLAERTPAELRGRVFGVFGTLANIGIPLSVLLSGFLVQIFGLQGTIAVLAMAQSLVGFTALLLPVLRQFAEAVLPDTGLAAPDQSE